MSVCKVGYMVGSLAKGPISRKLAMALVRLAPSGLSLHEVRFDMLPPYSQFESGLISDDGESGNPLTAEFLGGFMTEFQGFLTRVYTVLQRNA